MCKREWLRSELSVKAVRAFNLPEHLGPPLFNKICGLGWLLGFKGLELGLFLRRVDLLHHLGLLVV